MTFLMNGDQNKVTRENSPRQLFLIYLSFRKINSYLRLNNEVVYFYLVVMQGHEFRSQHRIVYGNSLFSYEKSYLTCPFLSFYTDITFLIYTR